MRIAISLLVLLTSCGDRTASTANNAQPEPAAKAVEQASKAFSLDEENELVEFHFGWSAEAAAVPQLVDRLRGEMDKAKAELIAGAREDKSFKEKQGFDYNSFMSTTDYDTAGQSPRLLSLSVEFGSFTGGAHGNYGVAALLWDRAEAREIKAEDLFASPSNMARLLTQRWCDALNMAREEKRGEPVGAENQYDECPKLSEIAIIPADKNKNGRFDTMMLVASPYVAGPYVEGTYEIELGVTTDLLAALRGDYRTSFEAQTQ